VMDVRESGVSVLGTKTRPTDALTRLVVSVIFFNL
jgi:hypothetical protein